MSWLPPRPMKDRHAWAQAHPRLAGTYFGLLMALFFTPFEVGIAIRAGVWAAILICAPTWALGGLLFGVFIKRRWGERPDAEAYPVPTRRRMWTRSSDRVLRYGMVLSSVGGGVMAVALATGSDRSLGAVIALAASLWLAGTMWAERRRRRPAIKP